MTTPAPEPPGAGRAADRAVLLALATGLGIVYLTTMLPGVGHSGDTTKFQYLGATLGTGHPPGEPLYVLLNAAWVRLVPVGTVAWRANLLSAVVSIGVVAVLFRLARDLGTARLPAAVAVAALGLSPLFWTHATVAEVYPLVMLAATSLLWLLVRWRASGREGHLLAALAVYGLSAGVHTMLALLAPGVVWFVWRTDRSAFLRPRVIAVALLSAGAGLATYGYLWWRTADLATPYVETAVTDLPSLVSAVRGEQFAGQMFAVPAEALLTERLPAALGLAIRHLALLLPFALAGAWRARRTVPGQTVWWWVTAVTVFALGYDVFDWDVFLLPGIALLALWSADGLASLAATGPIRARPAMALAALAPVVLGAASLGDTDRSDETTFEQRTVAILDALPPDAVLFTDDYTWSQAVWYEQLAEHRRPDVEQLPYAVPPTTVASYAAGERVYVREERRWVEPGRPLYAVDGDDAARLEGVGLVGAAVRVELDDGRVTMIYRMHLPGDELLKSRPHRHRPWRLPSWLVSTGSPPGT